jgi:hypothetical protein
MAKKVRLTQGEDAGKTTRSESKTLGTKRGQRQNQTRKKGRKNTEPPRDQTTGEYLGIGF